MKITLSQGQIIEVKEKTNTRLIVESVKNIILNVED